MFEATTSTKRYGKQRLEKNWSVDEREATEWIVMPWQLSVVKDGTVHGRSCTSEDFTVVLPVLKARWRQYLPSYWSKEVHHRLTSGRTGDSMFAAIYW